MSLYARSLSAVLVSLLVAIVGATSASATVGATPAPGSVLWNRPGFGSGTWAGTAALSPQEDRLFMVGYQRVTFHRTDVFATAIDTTTGARLWTRTFGGRLIDQASSVAVSPDGQTVFLAGIWGQEVYSEDVSWDWKGRAFTAALSAATGRKRWFIVGDEALNNGYVAPQVASGIDGGAITAAAVQRFPRKADYPIYSVLVTSYGGAHGAVRWSSLHANGGPWLDATTTSPDGSTFYLADLGAGLVNGRQNVIAYDVASGERLWTNRREVEHAHAFTMTTAQDGDALVLTGEYDYQSGTAAIDTATGHELWFQGYPDCCYEWSSIALAGGETSVFVGGSFPPDPTRGGPMSIQSRSLIDGAVQWQTDIGPAEGAGYATRLALSPDGLTLYAAGDESDTKDDFGQPIPPRTPQLVALSTATGDQLWSVVPSRYISGMFVRSSDGVILTAGRRGGAIALAP